METESNVIFCAVGHAAQTQTYEIEPSMRAIVERLFRAMATSLMAHLDGRTMSNPQERGDYESEKAACLSVEDLCSLLVRWCVFGAPVAQRRKNTVSSLSRTGGIHPKTLARALTYTGLVDVEDVVPTSSQVFDAPAGERLVQRIHDSLSLQDLPRYLNCNRTQAEMLVRTGFIPKLTRDGPGVTGVLKNVARENADLYVGLVYGVFHWHQGCRTSLAPRPICLAQ